MQLIALLTIPKASMMTAALPHDLFQYESGLWGSAFGGHSLGWWLFRLHLFAISRGFSVDNGTRIGGIYGDYGIVRFPQ